MSHAIERFFAAWGDPDPDVRAATLRESLSPDITYLDPQTPEAITDVEALIEYVGKYSEYMPGATAKAVRITTTKNTCRATVQFLRSDGTEQLGQYFIELDSQSRLKRLTGFVGLGEPE